MSRLGITGMRCAADDIVAVCSNLSELEWQTPSAAAGWTVHDIIIHVGALLEVLQGAVRGEVMPDGTIEALNDLMVAEAATGIPPAHWTTCTSNLSRPCRCSPDCRKNPWPP